MNLTESMQNSGAQPITQQGLRPGAPMTRQETGNPIAHAAGVAAQKERPRISGYGLPCAQCRTYYSADLPSCPVCKSAERVSAVVAAASPVAEVESPTSSTALDEERERFLREIKSQVYIRQMHVNHVSPHGCTKTENHPSGSKEAVICQDCYDQLREQVDLYEAALHMDIKEAAQLVYDAVWADASDPSRTYQNAAQALIAELRRRAGIPSVLGPLQTLQH